MKKLWICAVVVGVLVAAGATWAQIGTSGIVGTVMDKSGAVVPGAKVIATNEATNISNDTTTTSAGAYSFPGLIVGSYTIAVEAPGFKKWVGRQNVLTVGAPLVVNVQLEVGSLTSTVQVEGTYERLQTTNAMISDVIDRRAIANLPLNGRNPLNLIALQPGLVQRSNGNAGSGTHVNGSRDRAFNVTLDGIDINEPSVPNPQSNVYRIGTDNVQEYRVVTQDPTAEYGRNSGANISMVTRAGTNVIHGDVFEYLRNTKLNANDWFTNASNVQKQAQGQPLVTKPGLKYNQFGADVGGPIFKNKTFFYASWVGQRLNFTESIAQAFGEIPQVLTPMARAGKLRYVVGTVNGVRFNDPSLVDSQGNLLPGILTCSSTVTMNCVATYDVVANDPMLSTGGGLDPAMKAFINGGSFGRLNFMPTPPPNDKTVGDGLNTLGFRWNPPSSQPEERFLGRVDHQINENNSLFVRYLIAFADTKEGDFLNARPEVFPGFPPLGGVTRRPSNLAIGYRRVFSPQLVNQFTIGYARFKFGFLFGKANPNFPNIAPFNLFAGNSDLVDTPYNTNGSETARWLTTIEYLDDLSYTRGAHLFHFGFNFRFLQHNDRRSFVGAVVNAPQVFFNGVNRIPATCANPNTGAPANNPFNLPLNCDPAGNAHPPVDIGTLENGISELLGIPSSASQAFFSSGLSGYAPDGLYVRGARFHQFDVYSQDEWKVRPTLTVSLGLRHEFNEPATEARGLILRPDRQLSNFSQTGPIRFVPRGGFWNRENGFAFAPRIGLAWNPGRGKTVVRAGYAIAFDTISTFQMVPILGLVPGSSAACTLKIDSSGAVGVPSITPGCPQPATSTLRIGQGFPLSLPQPSNPPGSFISPAAQSALTAPQAGAIDPNLQNPTVHEWDLTVQRDLGKNIVMEVGYIGKRGTHLLRAYDLNQVTLRPDFLQAFVAAKNGTCTVANGCVIAQILNPTPPAPLQPCGFSLSSTTVRRKLNANEAGGLAALLDQFCFSQMHTAGLPANYFRPNPQFGRFFYLDAGGDSNYNGVQIYLRRHESNLDFGAAYTFAKSIDDMSVDPVGATSSGAVGNNSRTPTDIHNFRADRGRSDFDRTHVLTGYWVWNLPFGRGQRWGSHIPGFLNQIIGGWTGTGLLTFMTGEPFSVLSGNFTNSNIRSSRANIVGPAPDTGLFFNVPNSAITGPTVFSPSVLPLTDPTGTPFHIPPPGSNGNQGRNIFDGPHFFNLDLGVTKAFSLTERWNLQFRAELFNALNHPNFDNPLGSTDGSTAAFRQDRTTARSSFGQTCCVGVSVPSQASVISVGEPYRVIQFALRLAF